MWSPPAHWWRTTARRRSAAFSSSTPRAGPPRMHSPAAIPITSTKCGNGSKFTATTRSAAPRWRDDGARQGAAEGGSGLLRALVLAPDAERLLGRTVRDREQHRVLAGRMGVRLPGRHHENVVWT